MSTNVTPHSHGNSSSNMNPNPLDNKQLQRHLLLQQLPEHHVTPLLTDLYQLSMAYAYWKSGRHHLNATFDLYYRQPPFHGSFIIFAGLSDCIAFLSSFRFTEDEIQYISTVLPQCDQGFLSWLRTLDATQVRVSSHKEGAIAFPYVPLLKVTGPLAVVQLLETTLLNLINFASLVATNAYRFRIAAGPNSKLFEFGLRRAQGPNGGLSASKYCYLGGFDGTSNVAAGYRFGIPVKGTHAHSFVQSFQSISEIKTINFNLLLPNGTQLAAHKLVERVLEIRKALKLELTTSDGELAAFITYASVYPSSFAALVDTYSTLQSGVPNFMCVALALSEKGFHPVGVRLDSGQLAQLSVQVDDLFAKIAQDYQHTCHPQTDHWKQMVGRLSIMASNDITVQLLKEINSCKHKIKAFGIGTHLVTCKEHPALGCVFKLAAVANSPRMKLSEELQKSSIPGEKLAFRLYNIEDIACHDVLIRKGETPPATGVKQAFKSIQPPHVEIIFKPARVETLLFDVWDGKDLTDFEKHFSYLSRSRNVLRKHASCIKDSLKFADDIAQYEVLLSPDLFESMVSIRENAYLY